MPKPSASIDGAKTALFTARLTIGVTTELCTRSRIAAFQRGIAVLGDLLSRKFPANAGDAP